MRSPVEAAVPAAKISHATRVPIQVTRDRFVRSHLDVAIPARKLLGQFAPDCPVRIPIFGRNFRRCVERDQKILAATKSSVSPVEAAVSAAIFRDPARDTCATTASFDTATEIARFKPPTHGESAKFGSPRTKKWM